jgi:hypothetical protein
MSLPGRRLTMFVAAAGIGIGIGAASGTVIFDSSPDSQPAGPASLPGNGPLVVMTSSVLPPTTGDWNLMATGDVARHRLPPAVTDCRQLFGWAQRSGAYSSTNVRHLVQLTARQGVHVRVGEVHAEHSDRSTTDDPPLARLSCREKAASRSPASPAPDADIMGAPTLSAHDTPPPADAYEPSFDIGPGQTASFTVDVEPAYGPGTYTYALVARVAVNGTLMTLRAGTDGGDFRWSEDNSAIGYIPEDFAWTMQPRVTLRHCAEARYVEGPPEPVCSRVY